MSEELPTPAPPVSVETKPFWSATADHKLLLPRCNRCQTVIWYPRTFCSDCGATTVSWFEASGRGSIYSFTICRRGVGNYRGVNPYVLAYVELQEGPRILTNIVGADPESLSIGQEVAVIFHDTIDGMALLRFRPISSLKPVELADHETG